jgi:TPR repeat protein
MAMTEALATEHGNTAEQYLLRGLCGQWIGGTPAERTRAHKEAVKDFTAALDEQPRYADAMYQRGCSYRTLNAQSKKRPEKLRKALDDIQNAAAAGHAEAAAQVVPLTQEVEVSTHAIWRRLRSLGLF